MSKERQGKIPPAVYGHFEEVMDKECAACFTAGEKEAQAISRVLHSQLLALEGIAIEYGCNERTVRGVFANFRETCRECFASGRKVPMLMASQSCFLGMEMLDRDE